MLEHKVKLARDIFAATNHLHGLTKTAKPLLDSVILIYEKIQNRDSKKIQKTASGHLDRQFSKEFSASQRKIVEQALNNLTVDLSAGKTFENHEENVCSDIARRLSAIAYLAVNLQDNESDRTHLAGIQDNGRSVKFMVSRKETEIRHLRELSRGVYFWNAVMLRPIRSIQVIQGTAETDRFITSRYSVRETVARLMQYHLEYFLSRVYGLEYGEDLEYVHEMRVAVRRLRAVIKVFKKYLVKSGRWFKNDLKDMTARLGTVRDLDVFQHFLETFRMKNPESHNTFLDELALFVQRTREREYRNLTVYFQSEQFLEFKRKYFYNTGKNTFEIADRVCTKNADKMMSEKAPAMIRSKLKTLNSYPLRMDTLSPDELHNLRINCKWLRYTAEFFVDLYPETLKTLIKKMTQMQDALGDVHDADIYIRRIKDYNRTKTGSQEPYTRENQVSSITGYIHQWQKKAMFKAIAVWDGFRQPGMDKKFKKIINSPLCQGMEKG